MSEWIDFAVYVSQVILVWTFLPRHSAQCAVPMIVDRDSAWPAKHPEAMRALERSRWFVTMLYVWTAVGVAALLAALLDLLPLPRAASGAETWEVLRGVHGVVMIVGLLGYFAGFFAWLRWLAVNVPLAPRRQATLKPRAVGDYLPLTWRIVTEVLTAAHVAAWLVLPALGFGGDSSYWGRFAFIAAVTVALALYAHLAPQRRPGYADRLFGEAYRRTELRVICLMRVALLTAGAVTLGDALGLDLARAAHLALQVMISGMALAFLRLRPVGPNEGLRSGYSSLAGERRSADLLG